MNDIILSINVVSPLLLMMIAGYIIRKISLVDEHSLDVMNKLNFRVFLSALLFLNIYRLDIEEVFNKDNLRLIIMLYIIIILIFLISIFILPRLMQDKKKCSVMIQGLFRGNCLLFGIPIAASLYGEDSIGLIALLSACIIPLYNILGVTILEIYSGARVNIKTVLLGIVKNPTIAASALAFLFVICGINIPYFIISTLESISKVTIPLAFIVLGGIFNFAMLTKNIKSLINIIIGKLIVIPGIVFYIAYRLGLRNEAMVALLGVIASPVPIASFTMAKEMNADGELAGQIVFATSAASIVTIFAWIYFLKTVNSI